MSTDAAVQLIRKPTLRLSPIDDVIIATRPLSVGTEIAEEGLSCAQAIAPGHKVATRAIAAGDPVRRYGQIIGFATQSIAPGQHVHTHNLAFETFERDYAFGEDLPKAPAPRQATFQGYQRADGRVATRNYIGVLSTVNCSATVSRAVADHFDRRLNPEALAAYHNIDGVIALTHGTGCGMDTQGLGLKLLERTMAGYARHANMAAVVVIGLGCEGNQIKSWLEHSHLQAGAGLQVFNIQDLGGTRHTVQKGIELIESMLPEVNDVKREPCCVSHLTLGLQCGGSDGYSGITANPALGAAVDLLVAHGATAILSETPEIYGAEHLLTRRAVSHAVGQKLVNRIKWWEDYTRMFNGSMDNNPSPGNKAGGLTTILEKSLGAVAKGGSTALVDVYEYAEPVTASGFVFMDTPGYDPVSVTGQVAGGANLICFTTGRGSAYGCAPAPSLKLATNSALWQRQQEDIDINCGVIVDGEFSVPEMGQMIFDELVAVASGERTKSERHGYGQNEFIPWQIGAVM
jgi:altronate hydrolase